MNNLSVNVIRMLSVEEIAKANSGHPGMVLGSAPVIYTLWNKFLNIDSKNPEWFNRDRFVLAAGHASSMLYVLLHLSGYDISIDDLKNFRQLNSKTPGHPEHGLGIDATSGPLGQGIAMATGMAISEANLAARYNKEDFNVVDHYTYVLCGDGDLQEGVTQEAMSLAGRLGLGKLIVLYDSNDVQLDGPVSNANTENVKGKYEAMNWHYQKVSEPNDLEAVRKAIVKAQKESDKPSIIECKTIIGYGSPLAGDSACHGAPLKGENLEALKKNLNYNYEPFFVPEEVYEDFNVNTIKRGHLAYNSWMRLFKKYKESYPDLANELTKIMDNDFIVPDEVLKPYPVGHKEASRVTGGKIVKEFSNFLPSFMGGSADLTKSTYAKGADGNFDVNNRLGRNINFGVREHAMGAIVNGMQLHHMRSFLGGFFVFSDYLKPAIRMAALMNLPSLFIFTHDSVAVGEDGPTHEPIEQMAGLRVVPNLRLYRPADANETNACFLNAINDYEHPSVICLSRQALEVKKEISYDEVKKGAYVIHDHENFDGILLATGSEVNIAIEAALLLEKENIFVRVVSMPSMEVFLSQKERYQNKVLPKKCKRILAIEMGASAPWYRFTKNIMGIDRFGVSGELNDVIKYFKFTPEEVKNRYLSIK